MSGASTPSRTRRPTGDECAGYYAGYFSLVPEGDIADTLRTLGATHRELFAGLPADKHDHRYAPGKWSVKELLGHLIDAEWIFAYRALRFARGDTTPLAAMDQDEFVVGGRFGERSMESLLEEYTSLRAATAAMASSFDEEILDRVGVASGHEFTVRSILYFLAGHELHHVGILRERYL